MAWVYSEELKAKTGNGWSEEPEPVTSKMAAQRDPALFKTTDGSEYRRLRPCDLNYDA